MSNKKEDLQRLLEQFYMLVNKAGQLRNVSVQLENCESLNTAAIHLIETIGGHDGINMSEIADKMGITRGAVSQMTAKLAKRGFVAKTKRAHSEKEITLSLTESGNNIYRAHGKLHARLYAELGSILEEFSAADLERISLFMSTIQRYMNQYSAVLF